MISETMFATRASSFWRSSTPTSEAFVRLLNSKLIVTHEAPIVSGTLPERRGLINETAFEAFSQLFLKNDPFPLIGEFLDKSAVDSAYACSCETIKNIEKGHEGNLKPLLPQETEEVREIVRRLELHFIDEIYADTLVLRPQFKGCGIINSCAGDLCTSDCLSEIKAGERAFRSTDLRQILIYCALSLQQGNTIFQKIEIYNPRLGISFKCPLETLCFEISGMNAGHLLFEIIEMISASGVSL